MELSSVKYSFTGGELLDRLDELRGSIATVNRALEADSKAEIDHAERTLIQAHERMDVFFGQEDIHYPIRTREVNMETEEVESLSIQELEADPEDYADMVEDLREIDRYLGSRSPGMDYEDVPSPCAIIDYSTELIEAWENMQEAYDSLEQAS